LQYILYHVAQYTNSKEQLLVAMATNTNQDTMHSTLYRVPKHNALGTLCLGISKQCTEYIVHTQCTRYIVHTQCTEYIVHIPLHKVPYRGHCA